MARSFAGGQIGGLTRERRRCMKVRTAIPWMLLVVMADCHAQNPPDSGWHFLIEPYAMFPNMKGDTGIADLTVSVDEDPQDIFDHLQMGAMLYAEAQNADWTFSTDLLYMELGADVSGGD